MCHFEEPMSNRKTLIDTLRQITSATLPELVDATGWLERKVRDTIGDCRNAGLVSSERDDVTGKPLYRLTKAGTAWHPQKTWRPAKNSCDTPAGGGDVTPAPDVVATSLASRNTAMDAGVVEPPKPTTRPARVGSNEIERMHVAIAEFCEWLHENVGGERCPLNLPECAEIIERRLAEGDARIAAMESNMDLPLRQHTNGARYVVAFTEELAESPEQAMAGILDEYTADDLGSAIIVRWEPVGKIELRPTLVPMGGVA